MRPDFMGKNATVLHMLPDLAVGGGQILLHRILTHMAAELDHVVCAFGTGPMESAFIKIGVRVHVVQAGGLGAVAEVVRLARQERVGLIHTNNTPQDRIPGQIAGALLRLPVINTFHALAPEPFPRPYQGGEVMPYLRQRMTRTINRWLLKLNISQLVAVSEAVRETQASWLSLPRSWVSVIHNGLSPESFSPMTDTGPLRYSLGLDGRSPILLCVGRLVEGKGQRLLVTMMERLVPRWPHACLILAGEGEDRALLETMIARKGLGAHVRLLGRRSDVPALMALSDIVVSASRYEGFGLAVLEAMAAARPVVAFLTPALLEFAEDVRTGIFVREYDPDRLAAAVDQLAADPPTAQALGREGQRRACAFTILETAEKTARLYQEVMADQAECYQRNRWHSGE
jgi:glycosyltransferase involved in cell wall biosynthesis